jgi:hypothetical protein
MTMSRTRIGLWAVSSVGLVLAAMALVAAQAPRPKGPSGEQSRVPSAGPFVPPPPTRMPGTPLLPVSPYPPNSAGEFAPRDFAPQIPVTQPPTAVAPEVTFIPIRLELRSGLVLEGQVEAAALPGLTRFGDVAIPLTAIRGLRLHEGAPDPKLPEGPAATVILDNDDSLTVVLRAQQIQVKTAWGTAIVDLPQVRSLLVTSDEVQWLKADGRWRLKQVEKLPSDAEAPKLDLDPPPTLTPLPSEAPREAAKEPGTCPSGLGSSK